MSKVRLALCQISPTVGDIQGNLKMILEAVKRAAELEADVAIFPELALSGYPPEDLLLKPDFARRCAESLERITSASTNIAVVVGFPEWSQGRLFNAAALAVAGRLAGVHRKVLLPNYGVFDEARYFQPGKDVHVFTLGGIAVGISVCEDIWDPAGPPTAQALGGGAELLINISASPYHAGKLDQRQSMLATRAKDNGACIAYVNAVGGQDELVFDGASMVLDDTGELKARCPQFLEHIASCDLDLTGTRARRRNPLFEQTRTHLAAGQTVEKRDTGLRSFGHKRTAATCSVAPRLERTEEIYQAIVLGVRDYVKKNGFKEVLIGASGGIDSTLTAVIAVDAVGKEAVTAVSMPSQYTPEMSVADAETLARTLGIRFRVIPIAEIYESYLQSLKADFTSPQVTPAKENIQARVRGNILMALSNELGAMVLTTGNKSEMSVGYCTLYGDLAGGFAPIKDLTKTQVYELARYRNAKAGGQLIPERIFMRPPTAELKPGQKDTDTLPPYDVLDPIVQAYVEEDRSAAEIAAQGFDRALVDQVIAMIDKSEYKRRQSPPGVRVTPKAFGKDRRLPITNKYRYGPQ